MVYACSSPCQFSSVGRAGLTKHQGQCAIFRTAQALRIEQRKARRILKGANLEKCKERIAVSRHIFIMRHLPISFVNQQLEEPGIPVGTSDAPGPSHLPRPSDSTLSATDNAETVLPPNLGSNVTLSRAGRSRYRQDYRRPRRYQDIPPVPSAPIEDPTPSPLIC